VTAAHNNGTQPYNVGVAGMGPSLGSGRVVAIADEWLTYDYSLAQAQYSPSARAFWDYTVKWLGQCP
jgi:hypothetical protein